MVATSPILYIALPLITAFLLPLFGKIHKELIRIIPGLLFAYMVYISVVLFSHVTATHQAVVVEIAGWAPPIGINLMFTPFSGFIAGLISIMALLVWMYSYKFKPQIEFDNSLKYFVLLMLITAGSIGVVLTGDLFNQFVFLEIVSLSTFPFIAFYRGRDGAEASFKYLMVGSFASISLLLGILIIYSQLGTLNMADIAAHMSEMNQKLKVIAFILIFLSFAIEAEMFPVNGWSPDAYSQAPGPVGAVFASMTAKAGIYAMIRMVYTIFDYSSSFKLLLTMGIITLIVSEGIALRQEKIKRMLAYSSLGQMGLLMIAFGINTKAAVIAGMFILFNHAVIKSLLFFSSSFLVYKSKDKYIKDAYGSAKQLPLTALLFGLGAFAIVGLPPFSGFWGKLYLLMASADSNMIWLIATILIVSLIEIVYYFRVVNGIYFKKSETNEQYTQKPKWNASLAMIILALAIIVVGLYPDALYGFFTNAANALMDKTHYIHEVLPKLVLK
jgi:proton-translocating NADH-quinone oxidoreductase chain N